MKTDGRAGAGLGVDRDESAGVAEDAAHERQAYWCLPTPSS